MEETKPGVLFVCVHNSARSQMAEAFLKLKAGNRFRVESAGLEPGTVNPLVIDVMKEVGLDLTGQTAKSVFSLFKAGQTFTHVITVCDEASAERCPLFPGRINRLHWSFKDPSGFEGTREEKLARIREVREAIRQAVDAFVEQVLRSGAASSRPDDGR